MRSKRLTQDQISREGFTLQHRAVGRTAAWAVFFLGVVYAITTVLGFLSLKSPQDPIGEPFCVSAAGYSFRECTNYAK
ncbi:MAG: hypothetical protein ACFE0I_02760 [Elainellaceae cyanobacterium]